MDKKKKRFSCLIKIFDIIKYQKIKKYFLILGDKYVKKGSGSTAKTFMSLLKSMKNTKFTIALSRRFLKPSHWTPESPPMSESKSPDSPSLPNASNSNIISQRKTSWPFTLLITALVPVVAATILYQLDTFDPAPLPPGELSRHVIEAPARNSRMLEGSELVGVGNLPGPEDIAYAPSAGVFYTGCADGWINRVTVNDSVVHKWINTGGRPLGIAVGRYNELIVADPAKVGARSICELLQIFSHISDITRFCEHLHVEWTLAFLFFVFPRWVEPSE